MSLLEFKSSDDAMERDIFRILVHVFGQSVSTTPRDVTTFSDFDFSAQRTRKRAREN